MPTKARRRKRRSAPQKPALALSGQWDAGPIEQRQRRPHRLTERGEVDPETGKVQNPNNVVGVKYRAPAEILADAGFLADRHVMAWEEYERLRRDVSGSPARRGCLNIDPVGHDGAPEITAAIVALRQVHERISPIERAELDRVCWRHERPTRLHLLRYALGRAATVMGY